MVRKVMRSNEKELAEHNGRDWETRLFGVLVEVCHASASFLWRMGTRQFLHDAGVNSAEASTIARHSSEFLKKSPIVGTLISSLNQIDKVENAGS